MRNINYSISRHKNTLIMLAVMSAISAIFAADKAFVDAEFEDRVSMGKVEEHIERLPACGLNGSGGIRVHAAYETKDGVQYRFQSTFKPKAGRKYVFSVCRKVHGKVRAELTWQCWKGGWCRAHNWNTTLVPLDGGRKTRCSCETRIWKTASCDFS